MNVTINTDASFSRAHKVGSYAFWIVCDLFVIKKHGMLKDKVSRPEDAEFKCLINAIHCLLKNQQSKLVTKVFVNTDCLNVIHVMTKDKANINKHNLKKWGSPLKGKIDSLFYKHKMNHIPVRYKHVKAHVEIEDKRSYVNDWCDKKAKEEIKKWLQENETKRTS